MGFVADIVGGVADAVGGAVSGVVDAVGSVTQALGPVGTIAAAYFGMPYLGAAGATGSALTSGSILGGGMTGAGMMTAGLDTAIGGSLLSTAGGLGVSSAFSGANSFINGLGGFTSSTPNASSFSNILNSASSFGNNLSSGILPGESGGIPSATSGNLGRYTNLIKSGMDIYNAMNYGQGQSPTAAQQNADPYAPYRASAATQLNDLMANPNLVYGMPGYNFAQEQGAKNIQRQAAATGQSISGNTLASLQKQGSATAQDWFNNYVGQLTTQAGANQTPAAGQQAYSTAQDYQAKAEKAKQTALLQGILGAGSAVSGFFS
jgi:hypothetical protein